MLRPRGAGAASATISFCHSDDLRQVGRDHENADTGVRQLAHESVDLALGADIDAGGVVRRRSRLRCRWEATSASTTFC
jgi:hypothetical protein